MPTSRTALDEADACVEATTDAALDAYADAASKGLRAALALLAVLTVVALFAASRMPRVQPGAAAAAGPAPEPEPSPA